MIFSLLFLVLAVLCGFACLRFVKSGPYYIEEQVLWAIPLGFILIALWTVLWALVLPHQTWALGVSIATSTLFVVIVLTRKKQRQGIVNNFKEMKERLAGREGLAWLLVLAPWTLYAFLTIPRLLYFRNGSLISGWMNTWADWSFHLRNSTFLALHDKLPLEHAGYTGAKIQSHYIASAYLSSILQRLGLREDFSLTWPTLLLFIALTGILYIVARRITSSRKAAVIFVYLFYCAGGLGWITMIKDVSHGQYFWQASPYSPLLYTHIKVAGETSNAGVWFMNFIMSELFPQRAFLAGLPVALYVLSVTWSEIEAWLKSPTHIIKERKATLLFAGVIFGLLPIIHTHSYIALGIAIPVIIVARYLEAWYRPKSDLKKLPFFRPLLHFSWLLIPALVIGLGLYGLLIYEPHSSSHFSYAIHWWMPDQAHPVNPIVFWGRNAGGILILSLIACVWKRQKFRAFVYAGLVLFVMTNFLSFQPWIFDNLKILTYWYLLWTLPVAYFLAVLSSRSKIVTILLIIVLSTAGLTDVLSLFHATQTSGILLTDAPGIAFAKSARQATAHDPDGIIVIAPVNNEPLSLFSGRRLFFIYEGWLWSWGITAQPRIQAAREMYAASPSGLELIKTHNIHYLALGPQELSYYGPNVQALRDRFPVATQVGPYTLFDTTKTRGDATP